MYAEIKTGKGVKHMLILDKLWHGEVYPAERTIHKTPEYLQALREMEQAEVRLMKALSPEGKQLAEDYSSCLLSMAGYLERDAFIAGFRMAGAFLLDTLGETM